MCKVPSDPLIFPFSIVFNPEHDRVVLWVIEAVDANGAQKRLLQQGVLRRVGVQNMAFILSEVSVHFAFDDF